MRVITRSSIAMLLTCALLSAHAGEPLKPHDLPWAWSFDLGIVIPLALSALLYARGSRRDHSTTAQQRLCFWMGWVVLALSLISPLHPLGEVLFSAHMVQHELLMLIAAPLLVLSRPLVPFLWAIPMNWRRSAGAFTKRNPVQRAWSFLTTPFVAWWVHAVALWIWHAPALFQATLENNFIHSLQHISFLGSALLFWWSLFYARGQESYGAGVLYIFTTAIHTSILGALLTFSPAIWYPEYAETSPAWGLAPLQDQQIGGLIMWVPAGLVYIAASLVLFAAWMKASEQTARGESYVR